jgi:hypothetical protein
MAFTSKDMAEVAITVSAANLSPTTIFVWDFFYRTREMVVKSWPAATGVKLGPCIKQGLIATAADIGAILKKTVIFALKWGFSAPISDNSGFFLSELMVWHID